jgi:toxin secretion/phage lysis holin
MKNSIFNFLGELKPDEMQRYLMSAGATVGLFLSLALGGIDKMIWALFALTITDLISGTIAAFKTGKWDSCVGFKGIAKKVAIFAFVGLANLVDVGIGYNHMFRQIIIGAYAVNEAGSILENIDLLGYGNLIPAAIRNGLARLKETAEKGEQIKP